MTKLELVRELAEDFEIPRKQMTEMVEALFDKITAILKGGDKVQLTPFGQFKIRDRAARIGRNPQTGAPVNIPAKRVLKFIPGRPLKEAVGSARVGRGAKKSTSKGAASKGLASKGAASKGAASKGAAKKSAPARKAAPARKPAPARKAAPAAKKASGAKKSPARKGRR
jgi:DNA-binding protein HU-beta